MDGGGATNRRLPVKHLSSGWRAVVVSIQVGGLMDCPLTFNCWRLFCKLPSTSQWENLWSFSDTVSTGQPAGGLDWKASGKLGIYLA